jgi:uncharacterized cupredoxin-like copper-binding protein
MNRQHKMLRLLGAMVILGLFLTGCGGAKNTTLSVELADFKFVPNTFTIPAGKEITLNVVNKGANDHEFVILKAGEHVTVPFDDDDEAKIFWEVELKSGESQTIKFTAPSEAGTYDVVCGTAQHIEKGMMGTLTVTK